LVQFQNRFDPFGCTQEQLVRPFEASPSSSSKDDKKVRLVKRPPLACADSKKARRVRKPTENNVDGATDGTSTTATIATTTNINKLSGFWTMPNNIRRRPDRGAAPLWSGAISYWTEIYVLAQVETSRNVGLIVDVEKCPLHHRLCMFPQRALPIAIIASATTKCYSVVTASAQSRAAAGRPRQCRHDPLSNLGPYHDFLFQRDSRESNTRS
jgi:hypothetical protein